MRKEKEAATTATAGEGLSARAWRSEKSLEGEGTEGSRGSLDAIGTLAAIGRPMHTRCDSDTDGHGGLRTRSDNAPFTGHVDTLVERHSSQL